MGRTSMSTLFLLSAVYETISVSEVNSSNALCVCDLALQELEALLVQDFNKLRLEVLVAVPGPARH